MLPALAVMILVGAALRLAIGNKSMKVRMIPFQILACVAFLLEVGKQIVSLQRGYDLYHLPFHFCSIFIFALPFTAFYKGKYMSRVRAVTAALCGSVTLLMLIYPNLIYSAGNIMAFFTDYLSLHTVLFHNIVMFEFVLMVALRLHAPEEKGEQKAAILFTVGFCVVSAAMAHLLKTNYANFYKCNIPVFETLRLAVCDALGVVAAQLFYVSIVSILTVLFVWGTYWFYRLVRRVTK